jgi:hypothetical protein
MVRVTLQPLYPKKKEAPIIIDWRLGEPQSQFSTNWSCW